MREWLQAYGAIVLVASVLCCAGVSLPAHAQKGQSLSPETAVKLLQCSLRFRTSSWYFSNLRTVVVNRRSLGIYRSGWRALVYAMKVPQCVAQLKRNRKLRYKGIGVLSTLSGIPLYAAQQGSQRASHRVNYYNPLLIQWLTRNIPSNKTKIGGVTLKALYKTVFRRLVRISAYTYMHLQRVGYDPLVQRYATLHLAKPLPGRARWAQRSKARQYRRRLQKRFHKLVVDPVLKKPRGGLYSYYFHAGRSAMFWLRRGIDGTHKEVWGLLKAVLKEYDPNFLASVSDPRKSIVLKLPKLPPPKTFTIGPSQANQLQALINGASPYSKIVLKPGVYKYSNEIRIRNKMHLSIEGAGRGKVKIVVDNRSADVIGLRNSQNITIKGISARHANPPQGATCTGAVISVGRSQRVWITASELNGSGAFGVRAWGSKDLVITNNFIHSNTNAALQIGGSRGVHVEKNIIKNNASTLLCYYGCGINMLNNKISNNKGHRTGSAFLQSIRSRSR